MKLTEQEKAFVDEYVALCEKHGLVIAYDDGYVATEVKQLVEGDLDLDFFRGSEV